ncbi:WD repeat-containing 91, partial [Brachionus plicatilis]
MYYIWSIENPICRLVTTVSKTHVQKIEWDRQNSNILYIGTRQNTLKVYDLNIKKIVQELVLNKQYPLVKFIFSTLAKKLVVVQLRDMDKSSQVILFEFSKNLNQLKSIVFESFQILGIEEFSSDRLILACSDGVVRLFDMHKQDLVLAQRCHNESIVNIQINQEKNLLVTATHDQIYIWNIEDQFELDFSSKIDNCSNGENFMSLDSDQSVLFVLYESGCSLISLKRPNTLIQCEYQLDSSTTFNLQNFSHMSILAVGNQS